jgi:phage gpG-like protein
MSYTVEVVGDDQIIARFDTMYENLRYRLHVALEEIGIEFIDWMRFNKLRGNPLHTRSGRLAENFHSDVTDIANFINLAVCTHVPYASIHEYGGEISIPETTPTKSRALHWVSGGDVFAMRARAHIVHMPERSFMRSTLAEMESRIVERLDQAIAEVLA